MPDYPARILKKSKGTGYVENDLKRRQGVAVGEGHSENDWACGRSEWESLGELSERATMGEGIPERKWRITGTANQKGRWGILGQGAPTLHDCFQYSMHLIKLD